MDLVETILDYDVTESTKEDKKIFTSEYLGTPDNCGNRCYNNIVELYKSYSFSEHISVINETGLQSYSYILFTIVFEVNGYTSEYQLLISTMEIQNRSEVEYKVENINNDEEIKEKINGLLKNKFYDKVFIKALMIIKYFKFLSLDGIEDEDEDEIEEEYDDYLPTLELPFIHDICSICLDNKPQILLLPCLHICHCITCDEEGLINKCLVCREKIERKLVITK